VEVQMSQEVLFLWNAALTLAGAVLLMWVKEKVAELNRLNILINRTREEVARDNVTQAEIDRILEHIDARFNRLEDKINQLIRQG
jgi:archaellum component FlaC